MERLRIAEGFGTERICSEWNGRARNGGRAQNRTERLRIAERNVRARNGTKWLGTERKGSGQKGLERHGWGHSGMERFGKDGNTLDRKGSKRIGLESIES